MSEVFPSGGFLEIGNETPEVDPRGVCKNVPPQGEKYRLRNSE
jgi:hypothetical protein